MRAFFGATAMAVICGGTVMAQDFGEHQVNSVCNAQFGGDDDMVSRCVDSQREAFQVVRNMRITASDMLKSGIDRCGDEYWPDWESVRICSAGELEASLRIGRYASDFNDGGGSDFLIGTVAQLCQGDHPGHLRLIDQCLRNTLEAWFTSHPNDRPGANSAADRAAIIAAAEAAEAAAIAAQEAEDAAREAMEAEALGDSE